VVNGWEEVASKGHEQIVLCAPMFHDYPSEVAIHTPKEPPAQLNKWVLNLTNGDVAEDRTLLKHGYERPSLNLGFAGRKGRYGYLVDAQGARLIGIYDSQIGFGQSRVLLVWIRLIMPNSRSIVLERQPGADSGGYAGLI
jgi:carotenoid cleavage dioxygenase-like enzyme